LAECEGREHKRKKPNETIQMVKHGVPVRGTKEQPWRQDVPRQL
jgi:hypothetical protein